MVEAVLRELMNDCGALPAERPKTPPPGRPPPKKLDDGPRWA
jgi:hypothetical protein